MATRKEHDIAILRKVLSVDPATGLMNWRPRHADTFTANGKQSREARAAAWNAQWAGEPAMRSLNSEGYPHGSFDGVQYQAHRIVWALCHGEWPNVVDHINGDRADNRLVNLRSTDLSGNARNTRQVVTNKSGVMGVFWHSRDQRWVAVIRANGKKKWLGWFRSLEDAAAARKRAEQELGYHENHGRPLGP